MQNMDFSVVQSLERSSLGSGFIPLATGAVFGRALVDCSVIKIRRIYIFILGYNFREDKRLKMTTTDIYKLRAVLQGHSADVRQVAQAPQGQGAIVSASRDK
jgi:hypothetical protein